MSRPPLLNARPEQVDARPDGPASHTGQRDTPAGHAVKPRPAVEADPVARDVDPVTHEAWQALKRAAAAVQLLQARDGSIPLPAGDIDDAPTDETPADEATAVEATAIEATAVEAHTAAAREVATIRESIAWLAPLFPHDAAYLDALQRDLQRWADGGFGVPDFYDSLVAFQPQRARVDGLRHLVLFPMYTQNGSTSRLLEAVLVEVIWPEFVAELEAGEYSNALFVPIRFLDHTAGYDTNSAVLFPETVAMREIPTFTWGAIFADREAARFRRVVRAASTITHLELPANALRLLEDQSLAEETFVMWDLIHDRTHMRGDLPFDPFMIKQRMPFFLYSLEELRCDLTAFREAVRLEAAADTDELTRDRATLVQYAVIFDRIFRFAITGSRVRNYDGLGGQLLFAWLHQRHVLHWTDTRLTIDWPEVPAAVLALGEAIDDLYWRSIDRPKTVHWLAAYGLVSSTLTPHPASRWAVRDLPLEGPPKGLTDAVLDDEFPLSMFYEALQKKMAAVIESTAGITGKGAENAAERDRD